MPEASTRLFKPSRTGQAWASKPIRITDAIETRSATINASNARWFVDSQEPLTRMYAGKEFPATMVATPQLTMDCLKFRRLKREWYKQIGKSSRVQDLVILSPYQSIMAMGERALPFIFDTLRDEPPHHWFWALEHITQTNPVPENEWGDLVKMTKRWLDWAGEHGYGRTLG